MEFRTQKEMEKFENLDFSHRTLDPADKRDWNQKAIFDKINQTVVLTCHIQGTGISENNIQWLRDGGKTPFFLQGITNSILLFFGNTRGKSACLEENDKIFSAKLGLKITA